MSTASPSIFSSHSTGGNRSTAPSTRSAQATSSSSVNALSSEYSRSRCSTGSNISARDPPTDCVGESWLTSSGWATSSAASSANRASYSASEIVGASRW